MSIVDHAWGASPGADRVWCQVSGLAPSKSADRLFMVLQAFVDDSYKDGVYVLGGHIARAEDWAKFSKEWEEILPLGVRDREGSFHFKMSQMAKSDERMARVETFYRVLEKNIHLSISCMIIKDDLENAKRRVSPVDRVFGWEKYDNIFSIAFRFMVDTFHACRDEMAGYLRSTDKVDFYFDNQSEKKPILDAWDDYLLARSPAIRSLYGATPRFENDKEFLPLQAADLWAWWVRKWYQDGEFEGKIAECDFGKWRGRSNNRASLHICVNEDEIAHAMFRPLDLPRHYRLNYSFK
jgi:hypothetical protein